MACALVSLTISPSALFETVDLGGRAQKRGPRHRTSALTDRKTVAGDSFQPLQVRPQLDGARLARGGQFGVNAPQLVLQVGGDRDQFLQLGRSDRRIATGKQRACIASLPRAQVAARMLRVERGLRQRQGALVARMHRAVMAHCAQRKYDADEHQDHCQYTDPEASGRLVHGTLQLDSAWD